MIYITVRLFSSASATLYFLFPTADLKKKKKKKIALLLLLFLKKAVKVQFKSWPVLN